MSLDTLLDIYSMLRLAHYAFLVFPLKISCISGLLTK